jgi:succinate-semialdehyde dehydrogenase/glutarate-semialdehyde dehydrogenase
MNDSAPSSALEVRDIQLLIAGQWRYASDGETLDVINPARETVIGRVPVASTVDLDEALRAAASGFQVWRAVSPFERQKILRKAAALVRERTPAIARGVTLEQGKPISEAKAELANCADILEWSAEEGRRAYGRTIPARGPGVSQTVHHEPIGPVAAFTPWNFPGSQAAKKLGAALAAGCSVILKGPEEAPTASVALAQALIDAGLPNGVLNVVFGIPSRISEYLIPSPVIRKISFTGSVSVGKQLASMAAAHMKPSTMELGGHAPAVIFDDVDPAAVASQLAAYKFRNAGQVCICPSRFYVHERVYAAFLDRFVDVARSIRVGDGLDESTQMGPLANSRRIAAMEALVDDAVKHGAHIETGGRRIGDRGFFFEPTVLTQVSECCRLMTEEPFGPVAPIVPFATFDEVVARANRASYGLAAYAFTSSAKNAAEIANAFECGMVSINHFGIGPTEAPFGGVKDSGFGLEGGVEGLLGYTVTKFVSHKYA